MPFRISKLKNVRVLIIVVMSFLVVYILIANIIVQMHFFKSKSNTTTLARKGLELEYIVVHLDFKGAPPRLAYLESILPMLKIHGVNGLLIEYEDMFPYEGSLTDLRAANHYKKNELQAFLTAAVSAGFEMIPLIQTFGHLEYVLKHYKYMHLREVLQFRDSICPSFLDSKKLLQEMLKQIIRFHQKIAPVNYIHVGCDEVLNINQCKLCQNRNKTNSELMAAHLQFVTKTVRTLSPLSNILIWDDMFRAVKPIDCANLVLNNIDAVFWDYGTKIHDDIHINMYKYGLMFDNLWLATAFKGADGDCAIIPNLNTRFYNHLHWLNFFFDYGTMKKLYKIKGIILTGWSRYRHGQPLCELFPASIPSLILNLLLIKKYTNGIVVQDMKHIDSFIDQHILDSFASSLRCQNINENFLNVFDSRNCNYVESDLYVVLQNLSSNTDVLNNVIQENAFKYYYNDTGELSKFAYDYDYVIQNQHKETCSTIFRQLTAMENEIIGLLSDYYENVVILEYVRQKIRRLQKIIDGLIDYWKQKGLMKVNTAANDTRNSSIHIRNKSSK